MGKYRYARDYVIREDIDPNGRKKTSAQYIAETYVFDRPWNEVRRLRRGLVLAGVLLWAVFLAGMVPLSTAMKRLYTALPYAFCALWIGLYTRSVLILCLTRRTREPQGAQELQKQQERQGTQGCVTHQQADLLNNHFPASCMFLCVFSLLALAGEGITLVRGEVCRGGDKIWMLCAGMMFVLAALAFRQRRRITLHPQRPEKS